MPPKNDQRRDEILQVTDSLFRIGLDHDVTLDDVAKEARVSKGTIYNYFADKEDLFYQTETYRMEHLVSHLRTKTEESATFAERIASLFREMDDYFAQRVPIISPHQLIKFKGSSAPPQNLKKFQLVRKILLTYIEGIITDGQQAGEVRADVSPPIAARHMMASIIFRRMTRAVDDHTIQAEDIVPLFLNGIAIRD
jgi:AcrR family transcriptional regulator